MASNKVPLGIFWDIENCPVPSGLVSSAVAKQLRDFLGERHPECGWAEFACACDVTRMDQKVIAGLNANLNVVAHVTSTAKNAADDKLKDLIDMFIEKNADRDRVVLCLVTGDVNFANPVHKALRKNFDVVLIHGVCPSQDLKNLVKESYLFNDIIGIPKTVDKTDAAHLTVTNLPTDKPIVKIHQRLSILSSNCGGRPETKGDRTVINFGCKEDALRCLQRINGADVFGYQIVVTPGDQNPSPREQKLYQQKENNGPAPGKLHKSSSIQNLDKAKSRSKLCLAQNSPQLAANQNCQSVLKGVHTKANADPTQEVKKMVRQWKDRSDPFGPSGQKQSMADLIVSVTRSSKYGSGDGKHTLFVTAISPEASKQLIDAGKRRQLNWYDFVPEPERKVLECKSIIKGVDTKRGENVFKLVRDLVKDWNDKDIRPDFVQNVDRDYKVRTDGKATLYVTATTAETSKLLVRGAKEHLKGTAIKWYYIGAKKESDTTGPSVPVVARLPRVNNECKSVLKGFTSGKDQNVEKAVRNVVKNWKDPNVTPNFIKSVARDKKFGGRDGKALLFIVATSPKTCAALVTTAQKHLKDGIQWVFYERKRAESEATNRSETDSNFDAQDWTSPGSSTWDLCDFPSIIPPVLAVEPSDSSGAEPEATLAVSDDCKSIIYGLESKPGHNMAKTVRKIVMDWNEKCAQGNFIVSVERRPEDMLLDAGKYPLVVVARSPQMSDALVTSAQKHLKPDDHIVWVAMIPKPDKESLSSISVQELGNFALDSGFIAAEASSDDDGDDYVTPEQPKDTSGTAPSPRPRSIYLQSTEDKDQIDSTFIVSDDLAIEAKEEPIPVSPINQELTRNSTPLVTSYPYAGSDPKPIATSYPYPASDPRPIATPYPSPVPPPTRKSTSSHGLLGKLISAFSVSKPTPVSIDYPLTTGLKPDQVIRINGRPKPFAKNISIDFYRGSDIALHIGVRFNEVIVVLNSQQNGCWAQEERDSHQYFPFRSRDAFELTISVERNQYVIAVNGQPFCTFGHRMPYVSVNKLSFTGDLVVDGVRIDGVRLTDGIRL